ncbi:MAG: hypothetical protein K6347_01700 [Campylobacterales bacterium]
MLELISSYETFLLYGIALNLIATFGFGLYKSTQVDPERLMALLGDYPMQGEFVRALLYWFIPYLGVIHVGIEAWRLQQFINRGMGVMEYLEDYIRRRRGER